MPPLPHPRPGPRRRRGWAVPVVLALLAGLAGCSSDGDGPDGTAAADQTSAAPRVAPGGLHCQGLAIGLLGPVENGGDDARARGIEVTRGAEVAVDDFARRHPGCAVELVRFDTWGTGQGATAAARAAVADDRVIGVVGPMLNAEAGAVIVLNDAGLVAVSPSTTDPDLEAPGWKVFHRTSWAGDATEALAAWAVEQRGTAVAAVLDDGGDDAGAAMDDLRAELEARQVRLVATTAVDAPEADDPPPDLETVVEELRADPVDTVFYGGDPALGGRLVKALRDGGVEAQVLGTTELRHRAFLDLAGGAAEGVTVLSPTAPAEELPDAREFVAGYRMRHRPADPGPFAAEAHDAARVVLDAVAAGALTRASVLAHLAGRQVDGVTGALVFGGPGRADVDLGPWLSRVEGGRFRPAGRATAAG